jgi:hypothetical protein
MFSYWLRYVGVPVIIIIITIIIIIIIIVVVVIICIISLLTTGDRDSIPGRGKGFFLYPLCLDQLWDPPSLLYNVYRGSFPRDKARLMRDADHSTPSSAEVVNE